MKKFLIHIITFFVITVIVGEIIIRVNHVTKDIPQRRIDEFGIQKYYPNQEGYWKGGSHKWKVNEFGWPGELPSSFENLIMVIGDSYIENFMNPNDCHQSYFLKKNMPDYNFMEASRSGVSLIEAMEISRQSDTLNPVHTLIYVNDNDFYESIYQVKPLEDITQLNIEKNTIINGQLKSPKLKKILYSCKVLLYLYNRFPLDDLPVDEPIIHEGELDEEDDDCDDMVAKFNHKFKVKQLLNYISDNYTVKNKTLVFHPESNPAIAEISENIGFNIIFLDSCDDKDWSFVYDSHWTCYGHKKVAEQVSENLVENIFLHNNNSL